MAFHAVADGGLEYAQFSYGRSKLRFRGPARALRPGRVVMIGSSEVFGKFIPKPLPDLLEIAQDRQVVNLGCMHASPEAFLKDPILQEVCQGARCAMVQVMGAQNLSNPYFNVHPRRNDRFLHASADLRALYPGLDLTDIHFTGHLLRTLRRIGPGKFGRVVEAMRHSWSAHMHSLLDALDSPIILFWIASEAPRSGNTAQPIRPEPATYPAFISREMLDDLAGRVDAYVEVVASKDALDQGTKGMLFSPLEAASAANFLGPAVHIEAAEALLPVLTELTR
ncbi:MAG: DUF6473 family protein [Pseudomonadota bacterium]